jgi:hypothetical protein
MYALIPGDKGDPDHTTKVGFLDGAGVNIPVRPGTLTNGFAAGLAGAYAPVDIINLLPGGASEPLRGFADLFYFRVWMLPPVLDVQNPKRNQPIEFQLWNAYLVDNELEVLTPTNATGVTLDLVPGEIVPALGLQTVIALIGNDAPNQIDANFAFDFSQGDSLLRFIALLADILPIQPDSVIVETFDWLTDVLTNYDGSEQRIKLRDHPRRSFGINLTLLDEADRKVLFDKLFKTLALTIIVPSYQYQARLKQKTVIGDNKLYTNVRRADLRAGENVLIVTKDGQFFLYEVLAVNADHVTITTAFSQSLPKGSIVCGAFEGRLPNKSGMQMQSIAGNSQLNILLTDSRDQVSWPDYAAPIPLFKGKPLLLRRPLALSEAPSMFDAGLEVIDNATGVPAYYTSWSQAFIEGTRQYLIQSMLDQNELEFWRTFLNTLNGQQKTFYTPTYRSDLVYFEGTDFLQGEITVHGTEYASQYFEHEPFKQLQLDTDKGVFEVAVSTVENLGDRTRITFADPIAVSVTDAVVNRISFLMLVRLGSDKVSLTHYSQHSIVDLSLSMAVQ